MLRLALYTIASAAAVAWLMWHGDRQYKLGLKHGSERERLAARRARESIVLDAELIMLRAAVDELEIEEALDIEDREQ